MTAQEVIALARSFIGNKGGEKFWKEYGYSYRVEWCCIFVWFLFRACASLFYGGAKTAYVPTLWNWARDTGTTTNEPRPGDLVIFDWNKNGIPDHVGLVAAVHDSTIETVEGNVSDEVREMTRNRDGQILGYIKINYPNTQTCDPATCPIMDYLKKIMKGENNE